MESRGAICNSQSSDGILALLRQTSPKLTRNEFIFNVWNLLDRGEYTQRVFVRACLCALVFSQCSIVCLLCSSGFNMNEFPSRVQVVKWFSSYWCVKEGALPETFPRLPNPEKISCLPSCRSHRASTRKPQHVVPLHNPCLTHLSLPIKAQHCLAEEQFGPASHQQMSKLIPPFHCIH